ncbi:MAG: hypothetical protein ACO32J_01570 [Phycisphaerales bacterium]
MIERIRRRYERWAGRYDQAYGHDGRCASGPLVHAMARTRAIEVLEVAYGTGITSAMLLEPSGLMLVSGRRPST